MSRGHRFGHHEPMEETLALLGPPPPPPPTPGPPTIPVNTTGLAVSGTAVYLSAGAVATPTDAAGLASAVLIGVYEGTAGQVQIGGRIPDARFTTAGGAPVNGQRVWLALASDDGGTGAGKFTATPPVGAGNIVAQAGICLDASAYGASKHAVILLTVGAILEQL